MSDGQFIPPYPPRLKNPPSSWKRLQLGRKNFLAMWEESAFETDFSWSWLFLRRSFLCNSPESVQFAFSQKHPSFERKSPQMRYALQPLLGDGLFVSDGQTWRKRRRLIAPLVHISRMPEFVPIMVEAARQMRERWMLRQGQTIDVLAESAQLTAEIICRTIFGRELGNDYAQEVVEGFSAYQREIEQFDLLSLLGLPDWAPRYNSKIVGRAVTRIDRVLDEIISGLRRQGADGSSSLIGRLIEARDEETGESLDSAALRNEAAVLFMAGHETTANALAWTWYLLSQAPAVEARLHGELDEVLGDRMVTLADLPRLVYARAVFDETLRLYPPVPILPREVVRDEVFQGVSIPRGSILSVVPWLLHRHRKYWDRPDHFIPERFMPDNVDRISKFAYIPFSIGPRICAGMSFGQTEAMLCLATLAQKFRLRLNSCHEVRPVCRLTLRPEGGLPMTVELREKPPNAAPTLIGYGTGRCPGLHS